MTNYEITYIISPALDEAAKNDLVERFDNILKNDGADAINEFDRLAKINDGILRHMIVKRED